MLIIFLVSTNHHRRSVQYQESRVYTTIAKHQHHIIILIRHVDNQLIQQRARLYHR